MTWFIVKRFVIPQEKLCFKYFGCWSINALSLLSNLLFLKHFLICVENIVYILLIVISIHSLVENCNKSSFGKVFVFIFKHISIKKFQDCIFSLTQYIFNIFFSSLSYPKIFGEDRTQKQQIQQTEMG